jgi:type IV pilus assembly protein PilQ
MITRVKKIILDSAVALFLLVVFAGCAQTRANIKDGDTVEKNGSASIQHIKLADDASQVEILTDKPLSYTYYKTSDPPRIVIDLAQTEPGSINKSLEVNSGNIKRIEVAKHEFTGGFLSRIEIILAKEDSDFTVATDSVDKGKLQINFAKPPVEGKLASDAKEETKQPPAIETATPQQGDTQAAKSVEQPVTLDAPAPKPADSQIQVENKDAQVPPAVITEVVKDEKLTSVDASKPVEPAVEPKTISAPQPKILRAVSASDEGIEINVPGGVETFNAFKLTKPDRLVLDLPGVKSGIAAKTIAIDKFAVGQVRQGIYPDKIRIVMDAAKGTLPSYQVIKGADGLKVVFAAVPASVAASSEKAPPAAQEKPVIAEKKAVTSKVSSIEAIDFKVVEDSSQIAIRVNGDCNAGKPVKVPGGLSLTIKNCQVPRKLQRMIDTSAFPAVVKMITPYQVKMRKGVDARILVKLEQSTTYSLKQEGDTLIWDIKNPEDIKSASSTTRPSQFAAAVKKAPAESPAAPIEKTAQPAEPATAHEKQPASATKYGEKKIYTGRRVSLEFSDADIRKILQLIAEVSNLNFLIGDDVSGTISIKLVNVPWDQALDVILETKGLEKKQDGNIMYIKPKGKFKSEDEEEAEAKKVHERRLELKTRVFDINFAAVSDIASQFDKLKSDRGTIAQDDRTNRVIVTDNEERLEKMRTLLKALDMPEKQVMIEARIVEASSTFTQDLGVQWGIHYKDGSASFLGISKVDVGLGGIVTPPPSSGTFGVSSSGGAAGFSFGRLNSNIQLDLRLSAAASIGQVKVISTPKVITLNNKSAKISQGQSIPYQTVSAEGTKTEFIEAALTLEVTPHVAADGTISMKIKATNNSAGSGTPPPINKKEATTEVQVMNGETTVIGGIYQDSDTETDNGVPFLQDIPLFGWLFKSNSKSKTKTELLIFITPKIVS